MPILLLDDDRALYSTENLQQCKCPKCGAVGAANVAFPGSMSMRDGWTRYCVACKSTVEPVAVGPLVFGCCKCHFTPSTKFDYGSDVVRSDYRVCPKCGTRHRGTTPDFDQ